MARVSGSDPYVAQDSQADVRIISYRRCNSQGSPIELNQVTNRRVSPSALLPDIPAGPSAPSLPHHELREWFSGARQVMDVPMRAEHRVPYDRSAQSDGRGDPPPPYSELDALPGGYGRWDAPPPYSAIDALPRPGASGRLRNNAL